MTHIDDAHEIIRKLRMDITNAQAKLTDLANTIAKIPTPPPSTTYTCPHCGLNKKGPQALEDHIANVHYDLQARPTFTPPKAEA